ncbi:hypothetical protein MBLNU230_g4937t1 [Neophaeotheca triangularis]
MCFVGTAHFACHHVRMIEQECEEALEVPFFIKMNCPNYRSESTPPQPNRKCGIGGFYCKQVPDGEYLDQLCSEYLSLKTDMEQLGARIKSIVTYREKLKSQGIQALQANSSSPAPTAQQAEQQLRLAIWNRAQHAHKMGNLATILNEAKSYYAKYDQQQLSGTAGPALVLGPEAQPRVPVETSTFSATLAFPQQFSSDVSEKTSAQPVTASDYGPTIIRRDADEPHAPVLAQHAASMLTKPVQPYAEQTELRKQRATDYALSAPLSLSASADEQRESSPVHATDLPDDTPSKASPRKRKAQNQVPEGSNVRRSSRVANKKVNYADDDDGDSEGSPCSSPNINSALTKLIQKGAAAGSKSLTNKPRNPSPLRNSIMRVTDPSPRLRHSSTNNLHTMMGNWRKMNDPSRVNAQVPGGFANINASDNVSAVDLSGMRKDSVVSDTLSGSQTMKQKLQQAKPNAKAPGGTAYSDLTVPGSSQHYPSKVLLPGRTFEQELGSVFAEQPTITGPSTIYWGPGFDLGNSMRTSAQVDGESNGGGRASINFAPPGEYSNPAAQKRRDAARKSTKASDRTLFGSLVALPRASEPPPALDQQKPSSQRAEADKLFEASSTPEISEWASPGTVAASNDYDQLRRSFGSGANLAPPSSDVLTLSIGFAGEDSTEPRKSKFITSYPEPRDELFPSSRLAKDNAPFEPRFSADQDTDSTFPTPAPFDIPPSTMAQGVGRSSPFTMNQQESMPDTMGMPTEGSSSFGGAFEGENFGHEGSGIDWGFPDSWSWED